MLSFIGGLELLGLITLGVVLALSLQQFVVLPFADWLGRVKELVNDRSRGRTT